jgi:putative DNA primase/helicase
VASVLSPLSQLAQRWDVAILGLCHLTKGMAVRSLYRVQGSIAFVACARSVMAIGTDPEEPSKRILCHLKANVGPLGESHAFTLEGGVLRWVGKSDLQAGDVLGPEPSREDRSALDEAIRFLLEFLAAGPRPSKEVQAEAKAQGISLATIRRAEPKAGVERRKTGYQGQWVLELQRC